MNKEKNKFALAALKSVEDNIMKNNKPIYNPVTITGLKKLEIFKFFYTHFNKNFNRLHKSKYINYNDLDKISYEEDLIIIEEIDNINNNQKIQENLINMINKSLENNIQMILCLNKDKEDLILDEKLKCRLEWGLKLYLK